MVIGHLDDKRDSRPPPPLLLPFVTPVALRLAQLARFPPLPRRLQAALQLHVRSRVDDGVGDEFTDDHHGVVDEPVGQ